MFGADGETAATRNLRKRFHCKAIYCLLGRALISFCTANKHLYLKKTFGSMDSWVFQTPTKGSFTTIEVLMPAIFG